MKIQGLQSLSFNSKGDAIASNGTVIKPVGRTVSARKQDSQVLPELLLSVPFYLYEELSWINATISGNGPVADYNLLSDKENGLRWKHGDDFWFLKAAHGHPMRTQRIEDAKLFFVPTLLNHYDFFHSFERRRVCVNERCDRELLQYTKEQLEKSPAFRTFPGRHLIVRSHWRQRKNDGARGNKNDPVYAKFFFEMVPSMNVVNFEGEVSPTDKYNVPAYKVGTPCEQGVGLNKTLDFALIANMKFEDRRNLCDWLNRSSSLMGYTSVCGRGVRCPTIAQAKFGFHIHGDTWGSQRLMDLLVSGTVPIFTHIAQFDVQGGWIDWKQLSYYLPIHNLSHYIVSNRRAGRFQMNEDQVESYFLKRIERIHRDKDGYERRHRAVLEHSPFFDMTTSYPFDTYMYLLQAQLFPESRSAQSRWSALILPPLLYEEP